MRSHEGDQRLLQLQLGTTDRQVRVKERLTQEQLAARAGLGVRHLQKVEAGGVNVTLDTIRRLAHALRVQPAALLLARTEASARPYRRSQ